METKTKTKYWYSFYTEFCPICGKEKTYKQREYGEKPKDYQQIYKVYERYDWCNEGYF